MRSSASLGEDARRDARRPDRVPDADGWRQPTGRSAAMQGSRAGRTPTPQLGNIETPEAKRWSLVTSRDGDFAYSGYPVVARLSRNYRAVLRV
jgi:hypothetical protein